MARGAWYLDDRIRLVRPILDDEGKETGETVYVLTRGDTAEVTRSRPLYSRIRGDVRRMSSKAERLDRKLTKLRAHAARVALRSGELTDDNKAAAEELAEMLDADLTEQEVEDLADAIDEISDEVDDFYLTHGCSAEELITISEMLCGEKGALVSIDGDDRTGEQDAEWLRRHWIPGRFVGLWYEWATKLFTIDAQAAKS